MFVNFGRKLLIYIFKSQMHINYQKRNADKTRLKGVSKYIYFDKKDYYLKQDCKVFQDNSNLNKIYLRDEGQVFLRSYKLQV